MFSVCSNIGEIYYVIIYYLFECLEFVTNEITLKFKTSVKLYEIIK